jgi:hypothetical protein
MFQPYNTIPSQKVLIDCEKAIKVLKNRIEQEWRDEYEDYCSSIFTRLFTKPWCLNDRGRLHWTARYDDDMIMLQKLKTLAEANPDGSMFLTVDDVTLIKDYTELR